MDELGWSGLGHMTEPDHHKYKDPNYKKFRLVDICPRFAEIQLHGGGAKSKKVDLLRYFWKIDLEKIDFFYFFDLYFCFLKAFFGLNR